ncbi:MULTISPECIES: DUF167 domain-containing protein [unclassified Thioalkalivibrio]|uniref:DUF167 domain-containing protein n=1 Tax=unclassified Thioalkalivibrio TaxID=2621013 RepID=UPI00035D6DE1|nr:MULTISPECIES: DUF167 domain-containing protein [unclassified Thioalkalivibrio]PYG03874.1 hypothetical protein D893_00415 [Thioalkalivibrio sp. ALE21]
MARLKLRVSPGAREDAVVGWMGEALKLRVRAAPEKGRANRAVERLLAAELGLPAGSLRVVAGQTGRDKTVEIDGWSDAALREHFGG